MINKLQKFFPLIFLFTILLFVYKPWFAINPLTALDFNYVYETAFNEMLYPYAWNLNRAAGLGGFYAPILWNYIVQILPVNVIGKISGLDWIFIQRALFFYPFIILSVFSSYFFAKKLNLFKKFILLTPAIYILNPYVLMLTGGGQIIIGLAYALSPIVLYLFISIYNFLNNDIKKTKQYFNNLYKSIVAGLLLSILAFLDIRIAYIVMTGIFLYFLLHLDSVLKRQIINVLFLFIIPCLIMLLLHAFWLIPTALSGGNPISTAGVAYSTDMAVKFFSFAKLENSISLLHANWPENIFGKVYFMKAEFLIVPILAFSSLLFLNKKTDKNERKYILYFALLGLLGAFLAKGSNDPFGHTYIKLFENIPGFNMFRDASKWYVLIAISYSVLIPYSVAKIYDWIKINCNTVGNKYLNIQNLFLLLVMSILLFLIRPALTGQLSGTFNPTPVPQEYIQLKNYLSHQDNFFRTIWIPHNPRFSYYSSAHPAMPSRDFFNTSDIKKLVFIMKQNNTLQELQEANVKYVIIPFDSEGEIFLTDRKYDEKIYNNLVSELDKISWLNKIENFGNNIVYEVPSRKDHFWSNDENMHITYKYINPTRYAVNVKNAKSNSTLIFSESYDPGWEAIINPNYTKLKSSKYKNKYNSFVLPRNGDYKIDLYYKPQRLVDLGLAISALSLFMILSLLYWTKKKSI